MTLTGYHYVINQVQIWNEHILLSLSLVQTLVHCVQVMLHDYVMHHETVPGTHPFIVKTP